MLTRLARRMETEMTWDQSAWNQEQFHPSHGAVAAVGVSSRVMNYFCFQNSKLFFRFLREDDQARPQGLATAHAGAHITPRLTHSAPLSCFATARHRRVSTHPWASFHLKVFPFEGLACPQASVTRRSL